MHCPHHTTKFLGSFGPPWTRLSLLPQSFCSERPCLSTNLSKSTAVLRDPWGFKCKDSRLIPASPQAWLSIESLPRAVNLKDVAVRLLNAHLLGCQGHVPALWPLPSGFPGRMRCCERGSVATLAGICLGQEATPAWHQRALSQPPGLLCPCGAPQVTENCPLLHLLSLPRGNMVTGQVCECQALRD